jgi:HPt (histidine-containing phosphotransfer) domain-containing protein
VSRGLDHNNGDTDEYREILGRFLESLPALANAYSQQQTAAEQSSVHAAGE